MIRQDKEIKRRILDELIKDVSVDASRISVVALNGVVTLIGEVPTLFNKLSAIDNALSIYGVVKVNDQINICFSATAEASADSETNQYLYERLVTDPVISSSGGTVTLKGVVDAYWKKKYAENIVARERGVIAVDNQLAVVPVEEISDLTLAKNIDALLEAKEGVDAGKVDLEVSDGQVTLSGNLSNRHERKEVVDSVVYTAGVTAVVNNLSIY